MFILTKVFIRFSAPSYLSNTEKFKKVGILRYISLTTMSTFQGRADIYGGIHIHSHKEGCDEVTFGQKLSLSIEKWIEEKKRGIWFKVDLKHADWVPILAKNDFTFHHAKGDYVMMCRWLPQTEENNIPEFAHTMMGVGAVVVNDNDEVLVVSEKARIASYWKLPGGYVEPGENLVDAAMREVYEETKIHTEFLSILALRHAHADIQKCDNEIADAQWMKIDEYLKHPEVHELNRFFVEKYLENKRNCVDIECEHRVHEMLKKPYTLYHAKLNKL